MESLSSENRSLALDILYDIRSAIERLQERTKEIHHIDDFLGLETSSRTTILMSMQTRFFG